MSSHSQSANLIFQRQQTLSKLQSESWKYYTYPCNACRRRTKDQFDRLTENKPTPEVGAPGGEAMGAGDGEEEG